MKAEEQLVFAANLKEFLEDKQVIDKKTYVEFIRILPPSFVSKLRLLPSTSLGKRLDHLYHVCSIALEPEQVFKDEDLELESLESLSEEFPEDCDVVFRGMSSGKLYFVDVTSSKRQDILAHKVEKLEALSKRYDNGYDNTGYFIHGFDSSPFGVDIDTVKKQDNAETPLLELLQTSLKMSTTDRTKFYANVDSLYSRVIPHLANNNHTAGMYKEVSVSSKLKAAASNCLANNDPMKAIELIKWAKKDTYSPFVDAIRKLAHKFKKVKHPFRYPASRIAKHPDLQTALSALKDDLLAHVLFISTTMTGKVVLIRSDGSYDTADSFPEGISNSKLLPVELGYRIAAKHINGHVFTIKFSYDEMDDNLRRILLQEQEAKSRTDMETMSTLEATANKIIESENIMKAYSRDMFKKYPEPTMSTIFDKMNSMCDLSSRDLGAVGIVSSNMLMKLSTIIKRSNLGNLMGQRYEVANTFAASLKSASKGSNYYVGMNYPYDSVTITKMNSTQDSYKNKHYCVIGKSTSIVPTSELVKKCKQTKKGTFRSEFYTMNDNELVYELKIPHVFMSLLTWDLENHLKGANMDEEVLPELIVANALHVIVNRDVFAQSSEQVRYFYMSSIGYGAKTRKITEKFDFFIPNYHWEFIYMYRMIKMGLALSVLRDSNSIANHVEDGELKVAFPNSKYPVKSFSQAVSSMYYCNVFNKFRAFHEVSAAICYNELDDENKIYEDHALNFRQDLVGMSSETEANRFNKKYLLSEEFIMNETKFCQALAKSPASRFKASGIFIMSAARAHIKPTEETYSRIFEEIGRSPITACTMRGSMDYKESSEKNQSIRAASAILEQLMEHYGIDPEDASKSLLTAQVFVDKIKLCDSDFSILSIVIRQLIDDPDYIYRIVPKDQKGHREISVLNAAFRIGALLYEKTALILSDHIRQHDILESPVKDIIFEDAVTKAFEQKEFSLVFFDNTDQKRWGPNHMLHFFAAMNTAVLDQEPGLGKLMLHVAQKVLSKKAKFPESLIKFYTKRQDRKMGSYDELTSLNSEPLKDFFNNHFRDIQNHIYDKEFRYGMCQGIFQGTSSVLHGVMLAVQKDVLHYSYGESLKFSGFATSDDATRILMSNTKDMLPLMKQSHDTTVSIGNLMCILRNDSKSSANPHIAELNSAFYKRGQMALPAIKQRVSKIDAGSGENHYEDYLSALSGASNYFASGGSYAGSIIITILNLVIHTEQWNRWEFCNENNYFKAVEMGGFPVVEPFSTMLSGALSNFYLRVKPLVSPKSYSLYHASNLTTEPSEFYLSDFWRVHKDEPMKFEDDLKILRNSGMMGLFTSLRTDKKLSMFERRNKMSKWTIPDEFATLKKTSSSARHFIFNVSRTADMTLHDVPEGINSFYLRYTDPWMAQTRKIYKVSASSFLVDLGFETDKKFSIQELKDKLLSISKIEGDELIKEKLGKVSTEKTIELLSNQLSTRLKDANVIHDFISNQECEIFLKPTLNPTIMKLSLKGTSTDDKVAYQLSLIKHLAGPSARSLITSETGNHMTYDLLPTEVINPTIEIKNAIILSDNTINVFNKFVKSSTKLICSGKPSDMSAVVQLILSNRFTESAGVKLVGKVRVPGDMSSTFSYTGWYRDLSTKAREQQSQYSQKIWENTYASVVKYGIRSFSNVISSHESFEVVPNKEPMKVISMNTKRRGDLVKQCRDWSAANVCFSLNNLTISNFMSGTLFNLSEFLTGEKQFTKYCANIYFSVEVNSKPCMHFLTTTISGSNTNFKHTFIFQSDYYPVVTKLEINENKKEESWLSNVKTLIREQLSGDLTKNYKLSSGKDQVEFLALSNNVNLKPIVLKNTLTLAITFGQSFNIPISHVQSTSIKTVSRGYNLTHDDIICACMVYKLIADESSDFNTENKLISNFLATALFKSNSDHNLDRLNKIILKLNSPLELNTSSLEALKSLLITEDKLDVTISASKMYNTINNLCEMSDSNSNFILSMKMDSRNIVKSSPENKIEYNLLDFMEVDDIAKLDQTEQIEDDDTSDDSDYDVDFDLDLEHDADSLIDLMELDSGENDLDDFFEELTVTGKTVKEIDQYSRSTRTNHSLNPMDEYPSEILTYCHNWLDSTSVRASIGRGFKISSILDLLKYYSSLVFSGQTSIVDMIESNYGQTSIDTPLPLSVIAAMNSC